MNPQIKQAKLREEFRQNFPDLLNLPIGGQSVWLEKEYMESVADWWLPKISQAKLETLEAIIKEVEDSPTFEIDTAGGKREIIFKDDLLTTLQVQKELIEKEG